MFFFARLLAFVPSASFFRSPLGKVVIAIGLAVTVFFTLQIWIATHDAAIKKQALAEFNLKQIKQVKKDQAIIDKKLLDLRNMNQQVTQDSYNTGRNTLLRLKNLLDTINSDKFKDRPSSSVLRETVKQLGKR